jgi:hypothetical protein
MGRPRFIYFVILEQFWRRLITAELRVPFQVTRLKFILEESLCLIAFDILAFSVVMSLFHVYSWTAQDLTLLPVDCSFSVHSESEIWGSKGAKDFFTRWANISFSSPFCSNVSWLDTRGAAVNNWTWNVCKRGGKAEMQTGTSGQNYVLAQCRVPKATKWQRARHEGRKQKSEVEIEGEGKMQFVAGNISASEVRDIRKQWTDLQALPGTGDISVQVT